MAETDTAAKVDAATAKRKEKKADKPASKSRPVKLELTPDGEFQNRLAVEAKALGLHPKVLAGAVMAHLAAGAGDALTHVADKHLEERRQQLARARGTVPA